MSILSKVKTGKKVGPMRAIIYSDPKAGKTTLIADVPNVVVIPLEEGQGLLEYASTPQPHDFDTFMETLRELGTDEHPYKAVGIDGLTGVEQLIWNLVCEKSFKGDWEQFHNFARGPRLASALWVDVFQALDAIRRRGIAIWCAAHAKNETIEDVTIGNHTRVSPAIDKHALAVAVRWADLIGYIDSEKMQVDVGNEKTKKLTRTAHATGVRRLVVEDTGRHMAGNRYGLGSPIDLPEAAPYSKLRAALIASLNPQKPEATETDVPAQGEEAA